MGQETPKQLGSGIATARPDEPLDNSIRITYVLSEEGSRLARSLGHAIFGLNERSIKASLENDSLGVSSTGEVWRKDEDENVTLILGPLDLHNIHRAILKDRENLGLNEFEDKTTGRRIFARTVTDSHGPPIYEIWVAKDVEDTPILIDALFCLHFHHPAADGQGNALSEPQIFEEAMRVGVTFYMSSKGEALLPKIPWE